MKSLAVEIIQEAAEKYPKFAKVDRGGLFTILLDYIDEDLDPEHFAEYLRLLKL